MLKKTTIYLEESEIDMLKRISFIQKTSMTDLIRKGVHQVCESVSHEEMKVLKTLGNLQATAKKQGLTDKGIMAAAVSAQKDVRRARAKSRR